MRKASLRDLAIEHGSDKHGVHAYTDRYEQHFAKWKDQAIDILEIGIGGYDDPGAGGASLRMWRDYFPQARVFGLDVHDKSAHDETRIKTFKGSQVDPLVVADLIRATDGRGFTIIIDDGSHRSEHVIASFMMLFQSLVSGGLYVVEDTQTSYWPQYGGSYTDHDGGMTSIAFFKRLVNGLNWQEIHSRQYQPNDFEARIVGVSFYHNMVFIEKGDNSHHSEKLHECIVP